MELLSEVLKQKIFNTRPKIAEHMLIAMDKSSLEENSSQLRHTNNKQFEITVIFITCYNGIFNVTNKNIMFYSATSISDKTGFIQTTTPPSAYELERLNEEIKRTLIEEDRHTEREDPIFS